MTSVTTDGPQVTSKWNWSFSVVTDDKQTQSTVTTMKWNMSITDVIMGQLTYRIWCVLIPRHITARPIYQGIKLALRPNLWFLSGASKNFQKMTPTQNYGLKIGILNY